MALTIDIKANDDFERSAIAAAKALEQIAKKEEKIDALAKKLGVSSRQVVAAQNHLAAEQSKREKQILDIEKKKTKEEFAFRDKIKAGAASLYIMKEAASAVLDSTLGLGKALLSMAFDASQSRKEAGAMIDAFTHGRGKETIQVLDQWATKLGLSFEETRSKFVEFRQAGMDNRMSLNLIKMRADLMAMGISAKTADEQIAKVTAAGRDRYAASRAYLQVAKAFGDIGDGAKAAEFATHSFQAAQNHLKNVATEKLADLWDKVGPSIGKAANRLADFLSSAEGSAAIDAMADAITGFADAITSENLTTAWNVVKAIAVSFEQVGEAISFLVKRAKGNLADIGSFVDGVVKFFEPIWELDKMMFKAGSAIVEGLINGVKSAISAAAGVAVDLAKSISGSFAGALGIKSPSKLFASYGENTVKGFERGQESEMGSGEMPLQQAASAAPQVKRGSGGGGGIVIENINVAGGNADEIARSIRQELQLLLQAGSLSRGLA